jgi:chaperonin GroEL
VPEFLNFSEPQHSLLGFFFAPAASLDADQGLDCGGVLVWVKPSFQLCRSTAMPHKQILFRSAAREKILNGATQLADAVRVTLGPRSKSVLIEKKWGTPLVCNDGVTIAKEFDLKDPEENLGARMLREAAEKTGDMVGDGTSTATILAHAIFSDGVRNVVAGASAIDIKRGLDRASKRAIETLKTLSRARGYAQGKGTGRRNLGAQ